ncbi:MAG TPA: hypothetical protein VEF53_05010 [Patescibacteria group bacterium]|nr:hypothetical protein [Patescibacteria group bacterium]
MTHYYCTVLSKGYIHRGLILYNSLKKYDPNFHFYFVCLDDEVKSLLKRMALDSVTLITMNQIEAQDQLLTAIKAKRNDKEYIWSVKASVFLYLFRNYTKLDHILWLDGDTEFYADPEPIFNELMKCSILLTKERFVGAYSGLNNIYGIFNTGLMGFKKNSTAINCIRWFRKKCIEWCYDRVEPGKWSDQMYVNNWPIMFSDLRVMEDIGINVTAWNIQGADVSMLDNDIYINGERLVFYHYSGLKFMNYSEFDLCSYIDLPKDVKELIYKPYIEKYYNMIHYVNGFVDNFYSGLNYQEYKYCNYYCLGGKETDG